MNMLKLLMAFSPRMALGVVAGPLGSIVTAGATVFQALVAFFSTTLGRYVLAALIGLALFVAGDLRRGHHDAQAYAARIAMSEAAAKRRDADIAKRINDDADTRIAAIQAAADQLQGKVAEYEKAIATTNVAACRLTDGDLKRLRNLR